MQLLGTILLIVLGLLVGLLLLVLLVPLRFAARGVFTEELVDGSADVDWGFGFLAVHAAPADGLVVRLAWLAVYRTTRRGLPAPSEAEEAPEQADEPPKKPRKKKKKKRRWQPRLRTVLRASRRLLRSLRLRARLAGRFGTGDPADTAYVFGALAAARQLAPGIDTRNLTIDWIEPACDLDGQVQGRVWPAAIAWIALTEFVKAR